MFNKNDIVLIDTNVIIEAYRVNCWNTLAQYFNLHTVEKVIEETQTGFQNRSLEQLIDETSLRNSFGHIQAISELQVIQFDMTNVSQPLDAGEKQLIIYAHTLQQKVWFLNGPDNAAVKYACKNGWGDHLISLEAMNQHLRCHLKSKIERNFTESWLSQSKLKFNMGLL
ncbi:MAG: hypothetical protein ABL880_07295 [Methylotenera sp.]